MNEIPNRARGLRAVLVACTLAAVVAMPGAAIGQLQAVDGGPSAQDADQAHSQSWYAVDPPTVEDIRKANPKIPVQIVVASAEEIANQGVRGNGRVIYRIVNGILQIVVTDPAAAAELAKSFPDLATNIIAAVPEATEAIQALAEVQQFQAQQQEQQPPQPQFVDAKDPAPPPADFLENPAHNNLSPA